MWTKNFENILLVLQVLKEYFIKTRSPIIRRAHLKVLSDEKLATETNIEYNELGQGTFNRIIRTLEEKDALIAHRDKMHKFTQFYLNIPKIESLLDEHSYFSLFGGVRKEESIEEADVPFLSEVVKDLVSSNLDQKITTWTQGLSSTNPTNQTMRIARNAVTDVAAVMAPKVFTFYMTPPGADDCPVYDRESVKLMIQSLTNISSRNPEKPLKLTLEYSGQPARSIMWTPEIMKALVPHMEFFCKEILHCEFSKQDKNHLDNGDIHLLSHLGRTCFNTFWDNHFFPMLQAAGISTGQMKNNL